MVCTLARHSHSEDFIRRLRASIQAQPWTVPDLRVVELIRSRQFFLRDIQIKATQWLLSAGLLQ
ncbi:MAG: hypothetical protein ACKO96_40515, partial [Flammeovirgaceae bacterium]